MLLATGAVVVAFGVGIMALKDGNRLMGYTTMTVATLFGSLIATFA